MGVKDVLLFGRQDKESKDVRPRSSFPLPLRAMHLGRSKVDVCEAVSCTVLQILQQRTGYNSSRYVLHIQLRTVPQLYLRVETPTAAVARRIRSRSLRHRDANTCKTQ